MSEKETKKKKSRVPALLGLIVAAVVAFVLAYLFIPQQGGGENPTDGTTQTQTDDGGSNADTTTP